MEINYNFYGQPDTWANVLNNKLKIPNWNNGIGDKLSAGQLMDESITCWRINKNSRYYNPQLIANYTENGVLKTDKTSIIDMTNGHAVYLCYQASGASITVDGLAWQTSKGYNGTLPFVPNNNIKNAFPIVQFQYNQVIFVAKVAASQTITGSATTFDLYDYITNQAENYPYIKYFYPDFYTPNGSNVMTNRNQISLDYVNSRTKELIPDFATFKFFGNMNHRGYRNSVDGFSTRNQDSLSNFQDALEYQNTNNVSTWQCSIDTNIIIDDSKTYKYLEYGVDITKDDLYREFAYIGTWFTDLTSSVTSALSSETTDEHIYIPIFDETATTTGYYKHGTAIKDAPNSDWIYVPENLYKGEPDYDPTEYDTENRTVLPDKSNIRNCSQVHSITVGKVLDLYDYLYNTVAPTTTEDNNLKVFLTNNPLDCITSITVFPFDVPTYQSDTMITENIVLGNADTDITGTKISESVVSVYMGEILYYPPLGVDDFRSYEPYTSAVLQIPYCGTVEIKAADFINHVIKVELLVDLISGGCIALVYRDNLVIDKVSGMIGAQIPISGVQSADLNNAVYRSKTNQANAIGGLLSGVAIGAIGVAGVLGAAPTGGASLAAASAGIAGVAAVAKNLQSLNNSTYELNHTVEPFKSVGTSSPLTSLADEQCCRLIIKRPQMLPNYDATIYGETIGFACLITNTLGSFTGYTEISSIELSNVNATAEEKQLINDALQKGVKLL